MKIIEFVIDSLFPPRTTERTVRTMSTDSVRGLYRIHHVSHCVCLSEYRNPLIQALITENKFYDNRLAKELLAELLHTYVMTQSIQLVFVPIPLGKKREKDRGYNQVTEVLKQLKGTRGLNIRLDLCTRTTETQAQVSLPRTKRLQNVVGVFTPHVPALNKLRDCTVVVVDDVCTTGATLHAARTTLAPHLHSSCNIICVAFAH